MAKKKVKWTSYNKPRRPIKPQETLNGNNDLLYLKLEPDSFAISISEEDRQRLALASKVEIYDIDYDYGYGPLGCCADSDKRVSHVYIKFSTEEEIENPNYEQQLEEYKERYAEYKEDLASWWVWKAADDDLTKYDSW